MQVKLSTGTQTALQSQSTITKGLAPGARQRHRPRTIDSASASPRDRSPTIDSLHDGTRAAPVLFAEEGEAGTAVDSAGNVYVCAGNVFVYDRDGKQIGLIEVPERPSAIAFGGPDGRTLYIAGRTSLYAVAGVGP